MDLRKLVTRSVASEKANFGEKIMVRELSVEREMIGSKRELDPSCLVNWVQECQKIKLILSYLIVTEKLRNRVLKWKVRKKTELSISEKDRNGFKSISEKDRSGFRKWRVRKKLDGNRKRPCRFVVELVWQMNVCDLVEKIIGHKCGT